MHAVNQRGSFGNDILLLKSVRFRVAAFISLLSTQRNILKTLGKITKRRSISRDGVQAFALRREINLF
jgi:hypothetical protein